MIGQLFTHNFLTVGIRDVPLWNAITEPELDAFLAAIKQVYAPFKAGSTLNETTTEDEIIVKVLSHLGWNELLAQQVASKSRREDVPDMLLFADAQAKTAALKEKREDRRYRHGIAILESKRWMRPLDRGDATDPLDRGTPSNQILRYLSTVEIASTRAIRWGILTNGGVWRLYYQRARAPKSFSNSISRRCWVCPAPRPGWSTVRMPGMRSRCFNEAVAAGDLTTVVRI